MYCWAERREHEISDAESREARYRGCANCWGENEQEYLADVMVPLEVAKKGVSTQDLKNQGRELILLAG